MQITEVLRMLSGTIIIFGWFLSVTQGCDEESVYEALQACQDQREQLSSASGNSFSGDQTNFTELCLAFRNYVNCMDPRIGNCNGTATSAFKVIKDTYSADPYSCSSDTEYTHSVKVHDDINIPPKSTDKKTKSEDNIGSSAISVYYFTISTLLLIIVHHL